MNDAQREMLVALTVIGSTPEIANDEHYAAVELNRHIRRANEALAVARRDGLLDAPAGHTPERLARALSLLMHARGVMACAAVDDCDIRRVRDDIGEFLDDPR